MKRQGVAKRRTAASGAPSSRSAPILEPDWRRWLAENLLLGAPPEVVAARLVEMGCPPAIARSEIAEAEASPYFQASATLRARLAKRDWLLHLTSRHDALAADAEVPRRERLSPEVFFTEHYMIQRPVILTGMIDHWPAMREWSLERLASLPGDPEVEVQHGREKDANYEINSHEHKQRVPLSAFLALVGREEASNDIYLTANNSGHNRAALAPLWDEIGDLPGIFARQPDRDGFLWVGPKGTVTPWHHDLTNNLLVQIRGRKRVTLVSAAETPLMRNHRHCYSLFAGDANFADATPAERPRARTCELGPGDALFIPVGWWHHVVGLEPTIGLSFTNFAWDNDAFRTYSTYNQV